MKPKFDEDVPAETKGPKSRWFRKRELEQKAEISCGRCPFNKMENAKRKPKHSNWKDNRKRKFK